MRSNSIHQPAYLLGVDSGGTFTDFVLLGANEITIHKVLSTPDAPEKAILQGIQELAIPLDKLTVVHGTTVATNAVLEGKGVATLFITNHGFRDLLTIGRQTRKQLYQLRPKASPQPLSRHDCLEVNGRFSADGKVVDDLDQHSLEALIAQIRQRKPQSVAICLLFSFLDDRFEKAIEEAMPNNIFCCRSSRILPEYGEYERAMATWLNARVGPIVKHYLQRLGAALPGRPLSIMQSSAQTISAQQAANQAIRLLLSGPAAGLAGARYIADSMGLPLRLLTFDMGGTSTDVAVIDGQIKLTREGRIGDFPVAVPMVNMQTIGAGGGSLAFLDDGGVLQVGPQSAGARPGPACYALGGQQATVTDANLVLGHLHKESFLGGRMSLDETAAERVIDQLAKTLKLNRQTIANGIITIANEHMIQALHKIATERGIDPREFTLTSFGGAGGVHACALAEALGIPRILIPHYAGVLSALGMLTSARGRDLTRSIVRLLDEISSDEIHAACKQLEDHGRRELYQDGLHEKDIICRWSADIRYRGQSSCLEVTLSANSIDKPSLVHNFNQQHKHLHGHNLQLPLELVNLHVNISGPPPTVTLPAPPLDTRITPPATTHPQIPLANRQQLSPGDIVKGPYLLVDPVSTTLVAEGWQARCQKNGHLLLTQAPRENIDH